MREQQCKNTRSMKHQENMLSLKYINNSKTGLKAMLYCDLADKVFRIAVLKELSELLGNTKRKFSDIRWKIREQNELFTKE